MQTSSIERELTKVLWLGLVVNLCNASYVDGCLTIGPDVIEPVEIIRDLGVYFDTGLAMKAQIARVSRPCLYYLRRLRSMRNCLEREVGHPGIIYQLDYCNSILANLPASIAAPMQTVLKPVW